MHCNFQSLASQITTHNIKHPIHTKTNSETGETQFVCCLPVWVTAAFTLCNHGSSNVSKKCGMQHLYASGRWWKAGGHQRQVLGLFLGSAVPSLVISVPAGEADEAACRPTLMFGPGGTPIFAACSKQPPCSSGDVKGHVQRLWTLRSKMQNSYGPWGEAGHQCQRLVCHHWPEGCLLPDSYLPRPLAVPGVWVWGDRWVIRAGVFIQKQGPLWSPAHEHRHKKIDTER